LIATVTLIVVVYFIDKRRISQRIKKINNFNRRTTVFARQQSIDSSVSSANSSFLRKQLLDGKSNIE